MTGQDGLRRFVRPAAGHLQPADGADLAAGAFTEEKAVTADLAGGQRGEVMPQVRARPGRQDGDSAMEGSAEFAALPAQPEQQERCELCATPVPAQHGHVADLESASLLCACRACYLLFTQSAAGRGRYRAVPDRYLADPVRPMAVADWDQLQIPVGLAFFLRSTQADGALSGFYPSPAGATECRLELAQWQQLVARHPLLGEPEADVEAALISRSDSGVEYFLVPIDTCYELVGRMRLSWRGFDGGAEAKQSIAEFLDTVRARARVFSPAKTAVGPEG